MGDALLLWGKSGADTAPHPLLCHMLDAGMVARALLDAPQWRRIRGLLVRLGELDADAVVHAVPFLVALHDIGKAAPGFQRLVPPLWDLACAGGFVDCHPLWGGVRFRHDVEGYITLLDSVLPAWIDSHGAESTSRRTRRLYAGLAQALGGHHGGFVSAAEVEEYGYPQVKLDSPADGDRAWNDARDLTP